MPNGFYAHGKAKILQSSLVKLEQEFVHGYREGAAVFYISITNEDGKTQEDSEGHKNRWGPL